MTTIHTIATCRYDRDQNDYIRPDGHPCRHDNYGDPTHHCTHRRTCTEHIAPTEQTCARCLGRTRTDISRITQLHARAHNEALYAGVNSEAANIAGPAADHATFTARRNIDKQWIRDNLPEAKWEQAMTVLVADDDVHHPLSVLGRWDLLARHAYGHDSHQPVTVLNAAEYLNSQLGRIAQDPQRDFAKMGREIRKCRSHLERVMAEDEARDRGAPCPDCTNEESGLGPKLVREWGHWCLADDCRKLHYLDESGDEWVCPRQPQTHRWDHESYEKWIVDRQKYNREAS